MIVELGGAAYEGLRRATIDPSLPWKDYTLLESGSDRLEQLPAADDSSDLRRAARRCRASYVTAGDLRPPDRETLRLTQKWVDTVLDSGVYADGLLNRAAVKAELAQKEWAVASGLRDEGAAASIRALVAGLRSCAVQVESADFLYEDLQDREAVTGLGDQLRDLIASVSAHTAQAGDITGLEQQAGFVYGALAGLHERTDWLWPLTLKSRRGQSAHARSGSSGPFG